MPCPCHQLRVAPRGDFKTGRGLPGLQGHDEVDRAATEHDDDPHLLRLMTPKKTPGG